MRMACLSLPYHARPDLPVPIPTLRISNNTLWNHWQGTVLFQSASCQCCLQAPNLHPTDVDLRTDPRFSDDVVTTLPALTMYSRWVETEFFLSPIEKLVIATDPRARCQRLRRLRKYYTNPIARLSKNNNRRAEALKEQMKELNWLIDQTSSLSLPEYSFPCIPSVSSTSSRETEFGDGDTIRPLPRVAQMANDDVSVSDFAVYNRAMQRYLSESPQLSAQERSSMEELRSNRKKLMTSPRLSRITEDSEYRPASQRVSHARARRYMEEIDVRPEMRDPRKFSGSGFSSAF